MPWFRSGLLAIFLSALWSGVTMAQVWSPLAENLDLLVPAPLDEDLEHPVDLSTLIEVYRPAPLRRPFPTRYFARSRESGTEFKLQVLEGGQLGGDLLSLPILPVGRYDLLAQPWQEGGEGPEHLIARIAIPAFRCYFNRPGDARVVRPGERVVLPADLSATMATLIGKAQRTLDIAMSDFDAPDFVKAVMQAKERGVAVRFITDDRAVDGEPEARAMLAKSGVSLVTRPRVEGKPGIMHHKFIVIDGQLVLHGHAKANEAHRRVSQCFVSINATEVARIFLREFDEMWGGSGPESPPHARRFGSAKRTPRHALCMVTTLDGEARVDIGFSPAKAVTGSPLSRPLAILLAELIKRTNSDIGFLASGFGDTDLAEVIREAMARHVWFYGIVGEPDWFAKEHELVRWMKGRGSRPFDPRPRTAPTHEMNKTGDWINVHNRVMVLDVMNENGRPVACFSSAAWRLGLIREDDALVCIHHRGVAEQLYQHVAGAMQRAHQALPQRAVGPRLTDESGWLRLEARHLAVLLEGRFVSRPTGGELTLGNSSVFWGTSPAGRAARSRFRVVPPWTEYDFLPIFVLSHLGIQVTDSLLGGVTARNSRGVEAKLDASAEMRRILRDRGITCPDDRLAPGLAFHEGGSPEGVFEEWVDAGPETRGDSGLVPIRAGRALDVAPGIHEILADPQLLVALEEALTIRKLRLTVIGGAGLRGNRVRGNILRGWGPRRGAGLLLRLPESLYQRSGRDELGRLLATLAQGSFHRIGLARSLFHGEEPLKVLNDMLRVRFTAVVEGPRPGLLMTHDRRCMFRILDTVEPVLGVEKSLWDFDLGPESYPPAENPMLRTPVRAFPPADESALHLTLLPTGGAVYVDGHLVWHGRGGQTVRIPASPGVHQLLVARDGYHDHVSEVTWLEGRTRHAVATLVPVAHHLPPDAGWGVLRAGMSIHRAMSMSHEPAVSALRRLGVEAAPADPEARAYRIELLDLPLRSCDIHVCSTNGRLDIVVVDDLGRISGRVAAESQRQRISFTPEPGRRYTLLVMNGPMKRSDHQDLLRFAAHVNVSPAPGR